MGSAVNDLFHGAGFKHLADFGHILDRCLKIDGPAFFFCPLTDCCPVVIPDLVLCKRQAGMVAITYGPRGVQNGDDLPGDVVGSKGTSRTRACRLRRAPAAATGSAVSRDLSGVAQASFR